MTSWIIGLAILYVMWLAFLYLTQERLMFPGTFLRRDGDSAARPPGAEVFWIEREPGARAEAWLLPPRWASFPHRATSAPGSGPPPAMAGAPLVVAAHGNAELIDDHAWFLDRYRELGYAVLVVEYRGFARSTGTPGEAAIVGDFLAAIEQVVQRPEIDGARLIYHGRSIGAGVMVQVAAKRPPAIMVLESAFTSMSSFAPRYGAPAVLIRHPFRTDRVIPTLKMPILLMHGQRDDIIPISHHRRLRELAPHARHLELPCGHNDFPSDERAYWAAIESFLRDNGF